MPWFESPGPILYEVMPAAECGACGKVESIRVATANQQWTPLGTGVGVGGVPSLGDTPAGITSYKIGPGLSNQGMVVLGSAGGAAYKKTPNSFEQRRWEVTVRMDAGGMRILSLSYEPYALMMSRTDPDFRLAVNRALVGLYRSGEIDGIFQQWLGGLGRPGPLLHSMFYLNTLPE